MGEVKVKNILVSLNTIIANNRDLTVIRIINRIKILDYLSPAPLSRSVQRCNGASTTAAVFRFGNAVHGLCCRQNSCRVFKNRTASDASADIFSDPVSARFKSGCFNKFSKYSLSTQSSPSSLRASRFSGLTLMVLGRARDGAADFVGRGCCKLVALSSAFGLAGGRFAAADF